MNLLSFAAGTASGLLVGILWSRMTDRGGQASHSGEPPSVLRGRIVQNPESGSPAETGYLPQAGYASREGYEWAYVWGMGDEAGHVARAITGDDGRYQELLAANPHVPTVGEPGVYVGDRAWAFAPGQPVPGEPVLLPVPWSRYVDEVGNAAGSTVPFPPDSRSLVVHSPVSTSGSGVEINEYVYSPPPPRRLGSGQERVPYGAVALYAGETAEAA